MTNNRENIDTINQTIRQSLGVNCGHCKGKISPTASQPKDQELSCAKCKTIFHKRCNNRRKTTGNWRKAPWLCNGCIRGSQEEAVEGTQVQESLRPPTALIPTHTIQPQVRALQTPLSRFQALNDHLSHQPDEHVEDHSHPSGSVPANTHLHNPVLRNDSDTTLPYDSSTSNPDPDSVNPPSTQVQFLGTQAPPSHGRVAAIPRQSLSQQTFPTTSSRQRSSNVQVENPELEFTRTALTSCRSTITQQETELKTLKESIALRNKRILQLESQISTATEHISARHSETTPEGTLQAVIDRLDSLDLKLKALVSSPPPQPSNSIVINSCHSEAPYLKNKKSKSVETQTNEGKVSEEMDDDIIADHSEIVGAPPDQYHSNNSAQHL